MRGRILRHFGGLAGVAAIVAGTLLGARTAWQEPAFARADVTEPTVAMLAVDAADAGDRPALFAPARARHATQAQGTDARAPDDGAPGRSWSVRVVGPDEEPVSGVRVAAMFKRWGNTSYPHQVGSEREATSDEAGLATFRVPEEARFAWVEAHPPEGWAAPAGVETRRDDPLEDALRRVRFARSAAARRAPHTDVVRGGGEPLGDVTVHLDRVAAVSGRVDVPEGFSPRRVVATASWICPLDKVWRSSSVFCEDDGKFRISVPESAGFVDVQALLAEDEHCARPWRSVPDGPAASVACGPPPFDPPPPGSEVAAEAAKPTVSRLDLVPAVVHGVTPGAFGVRLRLVAACAATLSVQDEHGHAACAGRVEVVDAEGRCGHAWLCGPHFGRYSLEGLAAGTYELVVSAEAGVARVSVDLPATETTVIRLSRAEVSGRVVGREDADGWYVEWLPRDASSPGAIARVGCNGDWRLPVEPGARGRVVATCDVADERAGCAEADDLVAGRTDVVLVARGERTLMGRVVGIPERAYWDFRVHWTHGSRRRVAEVAEDGTFRLGGLPEGTAALELWSQNALVVRWPPVASGKQDLVLRFPSADDPSDAPGLVAGVGFTQDLGGR